jgi:hypothetical protein
MARKIQSINIVEVYEENNQELEGLRSKKPSIIVREHWSRKDFVVISIGELSYTVCAEDLQKAIKNAQNAHSII